MCYLDTVMKEEVVFVRNEDGVMDVLGESELMDRLRLDIEDAEGGLEVFVGEGTTDLLIGGNVYTLKSEVLHRYKQVVENYVHEGGEPG